MFPTIATPLDPEKPAPRFVCPQCGSDNIRIAAVIDVVFKPNDHDDPFVDSEFIGLDCDWEDYSDAWCNECSWNGTAANLVAQESAA